MAQMKGKLASAQGAYAQSQKGSDGARESDQDLDHKRLDRTYNPANDAERGSISSKLNEDSAKYKKGPGPL